MPDTNKLPSALLPSDFLRMGFPSCSIFGEAWHEMTAIAYLQALVAEGDKWQSLTPEQVNGAFKKVPLEAQSPGTGSVLFDKKRLKKVADSLTSADDAHAFSWAWRRSVN